MQASPLDVNRLPPPDPASNTCEPPVHDTPQITSNMRMTSPMRMHGPLQPKAAPAPPSASRSPSSPSYTYSPWVGGDLLGHVHRCTAPHAYLSCLCMAWMRMVDCADPASPCAHTCNSVNAHYGPGIAHWPITYRAPSCGCAAPNGPGG